MRLKGLLITALAASMAATSFAFPARKPVPPPPGKAAVTTKKAGATKVKGYTYKSKTGKIVKVKAHERKAPAAMKGKTVKVKAYTYKTKTGKTVHVKAHERKAPVKAKGAPKMP
ncbi:MAG TPA: hypothetical protein VGM51_11520 [Armatimonadota bacterium]|jgi:hypothetical protein